jgi:hypothetical protein
MTGLFSSFFSFVNEEDQSMRKTKERDSSSHVETQITMIDDDGSPSSSPDNPDLGSPDNPDLWMSERNETDT